MNNAFYRIIIVSLLLLSLAACTALHAPMNAHFQQKTSLAPKEHTQRLPLQVTQVFQPSEEINHSFVKAADANKIIYQEGQAPLVKTAPLAETVISLQPGEQFTQVSSGDPNRWSYAVAVSGEGAMQQQHILVKPALPDIHTNLVITTNRRLYTLRLVSLSQGEPTHRVQFTYPDALETANLNEEGSNLPFQLLHFNYTIAHHWLTPTPPWKPLRVFDDGIHTYIEFPAKLASQELPAFFVLDEQQHLQLANYRYHAPYLIVDTLFKRAVLLMNVGHHQTQLQLTHHG